VKYKFKFPVPKEFVALSWAVWKFSAEPPVTDGVPVIKPVEVFKERPVGKLVAANVIGSTESVVI